MAEARYRGQKVVVVSPDYADNTKFADEWLPAQPGTDGALAMAMGHVMLKEFFVDRRVPFFVDYVQRYTDLPFLVTLRGAGRRARAGQVPHRRRPRRRPPRARRGRRCCVDGAHRRAGGAERLARASATPTRAWAGGTSTSTASPRSSPCSAHRRGGRGAAAPLRRAGRLGRRAAPRRAGAPRGRAGWSRPSST